MEDVVGVFKEVEKDNRRYSKACDAKTRVLQERVGWGIVKVKD